MKYKVLQKSSLFKKLVEIQRRTEDANATCSRLAVEWGFSNWYSDEECIGGGIVAFQALKGNRGFVKLQGTKDAWIPNSDDQLSEMVSTPRIYKGELNTMVGLQDKRCAQVYYLGDNILIAVPEDSGHEPVEGMVEILTSQFVKEIRLFGKRA